MISRIQPFVSCSHVFHYFKKCFLNGNALKRLIQMVHTMHTAVGATEEFD